jgi:hypothetical protein
MDEVSFGPSREVRPQSRHGRAVKVAFSLAGVAAVGVALAVEAPRAYHSLAAQYTVTRPATPSASPVRLPLSASPVRLPSPECQPADPAWPNLTSLPAGLRPGALTVIVGAQFSGRCA